MRVIVPSNLRAGWFTVIWLADNPRWPLDGVVIGIFATYEEAEKNC